MNGFLDECRAWWRLYSVRLAAAVSAITGLLTAHPDVLLGMIAFIPGDPVVRAFFAAGVGGLVFLAPTVARLWPQNIDIQSSKPDASDVG